MYEDNIFRSSKHGLIIRPPGQLDTPKSLESIREALMNLHTVINPPNQSPAASVKRENHEDNDIDSRC